MLNQKDERLKAARDYVNYIGNLIGDDLIKLGLEQSIDKHWSLLLGMCERGDMRFGSASRSSLRQAISELKTS